MYKLSVLYFSPKLNNLVLLKQISKWSVLIFSIFWILYIFLDYWGNHLAAYSNSFSFFPLPVLAVTIVIVSSLLSFALWKWKKRDLLSPFLNGGGIILFSIFWMILSITVHFSSLGYSKFGIDAYAKNISWTLVVIGGIYSLVVTPAFVLGSFFLKKLKVQIKESEHSIINIAIGLVLLVFVLFILGVCKLLILPVILPVLLLILGVFWRNTFDFWRKSLLAPIVKKEKISPLGVFSFSLLLFFISINTLQVIRPYPYGFDSLSLYSNIASLIQDYHGLVSGFQPYNWSLLMSLGYTLFGKVEFSLGISAMGGLLSIWALLKVSQRWLDINHALLTSLLFYSLPTIGFQTYKDIKIDLGLLFIMLAIFIVFINWVDKVVIQEAGIPSLKKMVKEYEKPVFATKERKSFLQNYNLIILLGLLSGFAMGIKLTALFIIIAIIGGIWYVKLEQIGVVTVFFSSMTLILLGQLDNMSGLRVYHLGVDIVQWFLLGVSISLIGMLFFRKKESLLGSIKISFIYILFFLLTFMQWPIKNIIESGSYSVGAILNGHSIDENSISPIKMKKNWEEFKNTKK